MNFKKHHNRHIIVARTENVSKYNGVKKVIIRIYIVLFLHICILYRLPDKHSVNYSAKMKWAKYARSARKLLGNSSEPLLAFNARNRHNFSHLYIGMKFFVGSGKFLLREGQQVSYEDSKNILMNSCHFSIFMRACHRQLRQKLILYIAEKTRKRHLLCFE